MGCGQNYTIAISSDGSRVFAFGSPTGGVFGASDINQVSFPMVKSQE